MPLNSSCIKKSADNIPHSSWLETSQHLDAQETVKKLSGSIYDWLIVDHYALDERWEKLVHPACSKLMVIDDLADRYHDCNILVDQNYYKNNYKRYLNKVPKHCQLLLGPKYAILRKEYRSLHNLVKPHSGKVNRIFVFFGGIDAENCTSLVIQTLSELRLNMHVDVVVGEQNPFRRKIQELCNLYNFDLHIQTSNIAKLMASADLAIGAGGTSCWERCSLGLPTLIISIAENQIEVAKSLDFIGACFYVGAANSLKKSTLKKILKKLLSSSDQICRISNNAFCLVDGFGAERVLAEMEKLR